LGAQPKHFAPVTAIVGVRGKKGGGGKACVRPDTANENVTNALAPYAPSSTENGDIQHRQKPANADTGVPTPERLTTKHLPTRRYASEI